MPKITNKQIEEEAFNLTYSFVQFVKRRNQVNPLYNIGQIFTDIEDALSDAAKEHNKCLRT